MTNPSSINRRAALLAGLLPTASGFPAGAQTADVGSLMDEPHAASAGPPPGPAAPVALPLADHHPVAIWTRIGFALTGGIVAHRALPSLHLAMHDALNAAEPRFARHSAREPGEPAPGRASAAPRLAMAAAAAEFIAALHPNGGQTAAPYLMAARAGVAARTATAAEALGVAIGRAAARRMDGRIFGVVRIEGVNHAAGQWRPTPPDYFPTQLMVYAPFFTRVTPALLGPGPHPLDSAEYRRELAEVREIGAATSGSRSPSQSALARYWVRKDLDRSALLMAATLMEASPGQLHEEARAMAQIAVGMADTYLAWVAAKQHFNAWRPVTAIRDGAFPFSAAARWLPYLPTPVHPEFPSGHAADSTAMAVLLSAHFEAARSTITFQGEGLGGREDLTFESMDAAAAICCHSRLWAGAHFRSANDDGARLGEAVARNSLTTLPALTG